MNQVPETPENPSDRNPSDFGRDPMGLDDHDLWNLDDDLAKAADTAPETIKSYGVIEKAAVTEAPASPSVSHSHPTSFFASLKLIEKVCLFAILAALVATASLAVVHFSKEIPVESNISKKASLPVEGKLIRVTAIETYWRKPNMDGESSDIVRRGVKLIPSVKIQASGKSGAIRVFFRDSEGDLVGDSSTVAISGEETLHISATDGFTDVSMHASYRTGEKARWIIQAYEGPDIDAPIEEFHPLFETDISTDIR